MISPESYSQVAPCRLHRAFWYLLILLQAAFLLMIPALPVYGQTGQSAHSLGMADSYLTQSASCEAAALNPANLGMPGRARYSFKLFSLSGAASNNAFNISDYNKYNGAYLSDSDKRYLLDKIPSSGWRADFNATAGALTFSVGSFAFTTQAIGGGHGDLAKDPIELALMGNKVGELVTADGSGSVNWSALSFGLSYGREILRRQDYIVSAGVSVKYLHGLIYYDVTELTAEALTLTTGISGSGGLTTMQSEGGSGYAVDVGFAAAKGDARYGLVIRNLVAAMNWNSGIEETAYAFQFQDLTLENSDEDTVWTSEEHELPTVSFSSRPPIEIELGTSRHFGQWLAAASVRQGFEESAFVTSKPRVAVGVDRAFLRFLTPRAGVAAGGTDKVSLAAGLGFTYGPFNLDIAYASAGRLLPWGGTGGHLAVSTLLDFD